MELPPGAEHSVSALGEAPGCITPQEAQKADQGGKDLGWGGVRGWVWTKEGSWMQTKVPSPLDRSGPGDSDAAFDTGHRYSLASFPFLLSIWTREGQTHSGVWVSGTRIPRLG